MFEPDVTLTMLEPYTPTQAPDDYRCFVIPWDGPEPWVTGFRVLPDQASIVHHVIAFAVDPEDAGIVESLDEVENSLVIDTSELGREGLLVLFVALADGRTLDAALEARIQQLIRTQLSPRHRPDVIRQVRAVPTTLTGKKLEIPVKRLLAGVAPEQAVARSAVANPEALDEIVALARSIAALPAGS